MKTKKEIDAEIMEAVAKQRTQTADIEGMQKSQADDHKRNLLQILGDMLVKVSRLITWILVKIFRRGELPPEPEKNQARGQGQGQQAGGRRVYDQNAERPGDEPTMKESFNASMAEMRNAVDKVIGKVFDPQKVDKPLQTALEALGETPTNFDDWKLRVEQQPDGTFAIMSQASPSQEWRPFLEQIPTAADAAAVVAAVPRQEMDRIARAGRILKHIAEEQGADGVRIRARFTSAATATVLQGHDWRGEDFAEAFVPYLQGAGPKPALPDIPKPPPIVKPMTLEESKRLHQMTPQERMDYITAPPPPYKKPEQETTWGDYKPTSSAADASRDRLLSGLDRRKVGTEDEEDDLELELDGYGPRM
jgi:hypothetical protein